MKNDERWFGDFLNLLFPIFRNVDSLSAGRECGNARGSDKAPAPRAGEVEGAISRLITSQLRRVIIIRSERATHVFRAPSLPA